MQLGDLDAHLHAQLGVEVRQRLVEQERLGLAHDGAADGDALALAAGQLPRLAVHQLLQLQHARGFFDPRSRTSALGMPPIRRPKPRFSATVMCG